MFPSGSPSVWESAGAGTVFASASEGEAVSEGRTGSEVGSVPEGGAGSEDRVAPGEAAESDASSPDGNAAFDSGTLSSVGPDTLIPPAIRNRDDLYCQLEDRIPLRPFCGTQRRGWCPDIAKGPAAAAYRALLFPLGGLEARTRAM
ncbi:hypothetical protein GCM10029978_033290 [Actinoallomurus acanthiterrae]